MKDIDTILDDMQELRPQDVHEDGLAKPDGLYEPDEDDIVDLMQDCHQFCSDLLQTKTSKWVADDARDLQTRLAEIIDFNRVH